MGRGSPIPGVVRALPNALTTLRIALAVAFPWLGEDPRLWAVVVAAVSDAIDGVLARRLGAVTWVGALLDGIADKAVTVIVLVTFAAQGAVAGWTLALLLSRDATVLGIYAYVSLRREWTVFRSVAARPLGKITTFALFAFMIATLGVPAAAPWATAAAATLSLLAAADYLLMFARRRAAGAAR